MHVFTVWNMIVVIFQIIFDIKIYQNNIFFKKIFLISTPQNDLKTLKTY